MGEAPPGARPSYDRARDVATERLELETLLQEAKALEHVAGGTFKALPPATYLSAEAKRTPATQAAVRRLTEARAVTRELGAARDALAKRALDVFEAPGRSERPRKEPSRKQHRPEEPAPATR